MAKINFVWESKMVSNLRNFCAASLKQFQNIGSSRFYLSFMGPGRMGGPVV